MNLKNLEKLEVQQMKVVTHDERNIVGLIVKNISIYVWKTKRLSEKIKWVWMKWINGQI